MKFQFTSISIFILLISLGYYISRQINSMLDISIEPKNILVEQSLSPTKVNRVENPFPVQQIVLSPEFYNDELLVFPSKFLADKITQLTGVTPDISDKPGNGSNIQIIIRNNPKDPESFQIISKKGNIEVIGSSRLGAAYGIYHLSELILTEDIKSLQDLDIEVSPKLELRAVEMGAVGVPADIEDYQSGTDYSHHSGAFKNVVQVSEPFINEADFISANKEYKDYVHRMISFGYNCIVIDGFLQYINFDLYQNGYQLYSKDSNYRHRHEVLSDRFGNLFQYAHEMGMQVIIRTDMLALTTPLKKYLEQNFQKVDATDQRLWDIYNAGITELFTKWSFLDGLMVRIGEAGHFANLPGWDYYSELHITTKEAVKLMIDNFSKTTEKIHKEFYFRTWSVGVGEIGNMHTSKETYNKIFNDINDQNLVVSTKYAMGDFYSYLPENPTLSVGNEKRIIEFQSRREFEGMGALPNFIAYHYQTYLRQLLRENQNIIGIWNWTQEGGPIRTGPMILYPKYGMRSFTDINVYSVGKLGWDPNENVSQILKTWILREVSSDPKTAGNISEMLSMSRDAILKGLYIKPFADKQVVALGLEPPPMMWIFEWDIVSGSNAVLSTIYYTSKDEMKAAIDDGFLALNTVEQMKQLIESTNANTYYDPEIKSQFLKALEYQSSLFETLAWYRKAFLYYYFWLDKGDKSAWPIYKEAESIFQSKLLHHQKQFGKDVHFPAYDFEPAMTGISIANKSSMVRWMARIFLLISISILLILLKSSSFNLLDFNRHTPIANRNYIYLVIIPAITLVLILGTRCMFTSFRSFDYLFLTSGSLIIFSVIYIRLSRPYYFEAVLAITVGSLIKIFPILLIMAFRGPQYFWYQFWTNPLFNTIYITLGVALNGWFLYILIKTSMTANHQSLFNAVGKVLLSISVPIIVICLITIGMGLETTLTSINNQMAVLPMGLSKILGITTHLNIPLELPWYILLSGTILLLFSLLLILLSNKYKLMDFTNNSSV